MTFLWFLMFVLTNATADELKTAIICDTIIILTLILLPTITGALL